MSYIASMLVYAPDKAGEKIAELIRPLGSLIR